MSGGGRAQAELAPARRDELARLRRWIPPFVGLLLFGLAVLFLHRALGEIHYAELKSALRGIPTSPIVLALALTGVSFAAIACMATIVRSSAASRGSARRPSS